MKDLRGEDKERKREEKTCAVVSIIGHLFALNNYALPAHVMSRSLALAFDIDPISLSVSLLLSQYRMYQYVTEELPSVVKANFPAVDTSKASVFGHSMGGHGALVVAFK